jgi:hypothetical protein
MVKLLSIMLNIVIVVLISGSAYATEKIAVLDFKSLLAPEQLGVAVAEILRTELGELGDYTVIERGMLKQLLDEQALQLSGTVDSESAVKIGKLIGANIVVAGSIIKTGNIYTINSRFIEVETGIVKTGKNIRGQGENQISTMVHQLALIITGKTEMSEIPITPSEFSEIYNDDFTSGINKTYWKIVTNQRLYQVDDSNNAVRFSKKNGGDYTFQFVGLKFLREVRGDFDVRVDFHNARIDHADGSNGNQLELKVSFAEQLFIVVYSDEPWLGGHNFHIWADPPGSALGTQTLKTNNGTLRITREGSYVKGYFNNTVIFTSHLNTDPVTNLSFTLNNNGTKDATSVIFDNFYLSSDQMIPNQ